MGIKDRVMGAMAKNISPNLERLLGSIHAHLELQASFLKEIYIETRMKNHNIGIDEAKKDAERIENEIIQNEWINQKNI